MKKLIAICALFALVGCAQMLTSKTSVSVVVSPDGTCQATYSSDKEQQGLEARVCGGEVRVDKAGTLESVIATTAQIQAQLLQLIQVLTAGARTGVIAGS